MVIWHGVGVDESRHQKSAGAEVRLEAQGRWQRDARGDPSPQNRVIDVHVLAGDESCPS